MSLLLIRRPVKLQQFCTVVPSACLEALKELLTKKAKSSFLFFSSLFSFEGQFTFFRHFALCLCRSLGFVSITCSFHKGEVWWRGIPGTPTNHF